MFVLQLSDVRVGGAMVFPKLNVTVPMVKVCNNSFILKSVKLSSYVVGVSILLKKKK